MSMFTQVGDSNHSLHESATGEVAGQGGDLWGPDAGSALVDWLLLAGLLAVAGLVMAGVVGPTLPRVLMWVGRWMASPAP